MSIRMSKIAKTWCPHTFENPTPLGFTPTIAQAQFITPQGIPLHDL